tara:strand:+ start:83593 stop:85098 length:1506 start_codon:yes stop_codon:yes gene_type:complete
MTANPFIQQAIDLNVGELSKEGALLVKTGASTGRSTKERFVVKHPEIEQDINWGSVNQPVTPEFGETFFSRLEEKLSHQKLYIKEAFVGCFRVRVRSTSPWHIAFAENMFRETVVEQLKTQVPDDVLIDILHDPYGQVSELRIEHPYQKAIVLDAKKLKVGIVGTAYAGEIKKSAFTLCNFLFPKYGIFPMHASANCKEDGSAASVLFGLSGTGKTTLSADPKRYLVGDDEIVWSKSGISNLEGGCYAKLINLSKDAEPDIYRAANKPGSILENVVFDRESKEVDFFDGSITENTRGSYSIESLDKVFDQNKEASRPNSVVFLTADAFGALPALARLDEWQARYHFISGYTAKVAGTEIGVTEPEATFSACFGAPFMPRSPKVYAELLANYIREYNVPVWLLNTGWTGGGYGEGERFPISVSRSLLESIQSGDLENVEMERHPIFGFSVPKMIDGIDQKYLTIPNNEAVLELARRFQANAQSLGDCLTDEIKDRGGPIIAH